MKDVQNERPEHEYPLHFVGVTDFEQYITIVRPDKTVFSTLATITAGSTLPANQRGGHMSRFVQAILDAGTVTKGVENLAEDIVGNIKKAHGGEPSATIVVKLPMMLDNELQIVTVIGSFNKGSGIGVKVVGASSCPCSRELCNGKTHNQKSRISVTITPANGIDARELAATVHGAFSSPVKHLLKREEERDLVNRMIDNSRFVEDIVRYAVANLSRIYPGRHAIVEVENDESIHPHRVRARWSGTLYSSPQQTVLW